MGYGFEIKGIQSLLKKLDKLSHLEVQKAVDKCADKMEKAIQDKAKTFSDTEYLYIKKNTPRVYANSAYIDIGLKNENEDFEKWKGLWYQNWGFFNHGWNFSGQYHITNHLMWFTEAINEVEDEIKRDLKEEIKKQVRECWNG